MHKFWTFLDEQRIDDVRMADAYERTGAQLRGLLKKNIAIHHELAEQRLPPCLKRTEVSYGSTLCAKISTPAPWCLIVHDISYSAAPRALAAAVPAQLSGVPLIWGVALYDKNAGAESAASALLHPHLLAAWELAGIENVAVAEKETFLSCLHDFTSSPEAAAGEGPGRALLLGAPDFSNDLRLILNNECLALMREEGAPPRILLTGKITEANQSILSALHPDARLEILRNGRDLKTQTDEAYAAIFLPEDENMRAGRLNAPLCLDYEHSGCWLWPELDAAFFLNHAFTLRTTTGSDK